jgi:hypothetical protein
MVQQGGTFREINATLSVHHSLITRAWESYRLHCTQGCMLEVGKASQYQLRIGFLVFQANRTRFLTTTSLRNNLANGKGGPCFNADGRHCQARLEWTMEHTRWPMQHSRHVMFVDESRFCLDSTESREDRWTVLGCKYCWAWPQRSWGGISWDWRFDMFVKK